MNRDKSDKIIESIIRSNAFEKAPDKLLHNALSQLEDEYSPVQPATKAILPVWLIAILLVLISLGAFILITSGLNTGLTLPDWSLAFNPKTISGSFDLQFQLGPVFLTAIKCVLPALIIQFIVANYYFRLFRRSR